MFTRSSLHVGRLLLLLNMSSKKSKSKPKRGSEGDSSVLSKEDSRLQTSSHEGQSCKTLNSNSFTVIDFIDKGKNLLQESDRSLAFGVNLNNDPATGGGCGCHGSPNGAFSIY